MGRAVTSFLAGLGSGVVGGMKYKDEQARLQAEQQMRQDEHDQRMKEAQRQEQNRLMLADAARPATVDQGAGGMTKPASADNSDVGQPGEPGAQNGGLMPGALVNGVPTDPSQVSLAAAKYNAPEAKTQRVSDALTAAGNPTAAQQYQTGAFNLNKQQMEYARTLKDEGVMDAAKALRSGDAKGVKDAFNKNGQFKIVEDPEITPEDRELPGFGKVKTYNAKLKIQNPDGTVSEKTYNSHDLSMSIMPYDKALELQRKGEETDNRFDNRQALLDTKLKQLELTGQVAEARALADAARRQAGGGSLGREERLRYTSLFSDAGRRMQDTQKTLNTLQRDPLFMVNARKPGTPEAQQLEQLQTDLKGHQDERSLYQGLLANPGSAAAAPADASPAPALSAAKIPPAVQNARDGERKDILTSELQKAQARLAGGDPRAQGDIDSLTREIAGTKPTLAGARTSAAGPIKVSTKADRDKLPKGARYVGPDGATYIKQ